MSILKLNNQFASPMAASISRSLGWVNAGREMASEAKLCRNCGISSRIHRTLFGQAIVCFPPHTAWMQLAGSAVTYLNNIAIASDRSLSHQNIREIHSISSSLLQSKLPPKSFSCKSGLINNTNTLGGAMSCFCWKDKFFFFSYFFLFYFSSSSSSCNVSLLLFYSIFSRLNTQLWVRSSCFISLPRPIRVVQSARSIQNEKKEKNEFKTKQATDRKKIIRRRGK